MTTIGAYEAKTRFSELLERIEKGESFTITRHGRPVAVLAPSMERNLSLVQEGVHELRKLRKKTLLPDLSWNDIKGWKNEGRKE